jgi:hypothetical protein
MIRSGPYDISKDRKPGSKLTFIGELDRIGEPESGSPNSQPKPMMVRLQVLEQIYEYRSLQPDLKQIRLLRFSPKDESGVIHRLDLEMFLLTYRTRCRQLLTRNLKRPPFLTRDPKSVPTTHSFLDSYPSLPLFIYRNLFYDLL